MGGGNDGIHHELEHMLILIPQTEPTELIERIRRKYPYIHIHFHRLDPTVTPYQAMAKVPKGIITLQLSLLLAKASS
jgi:hypothetical protein